MKKSESKFIINLSLISKELEEHIQTSVDKYIEDVLEGCVSDKVEDAIKKYVVRKINEVLLDKPYNSSGLIQGVTLTKYIEQLVKPKVEESFNQAVEASITKMIMNKIANMPIE